MSTVDRDNIVRALRRRREALGLSQRALAPQIGTSHQLMSEWERGTVTPNLASLLRWVQALDCRLVVEPISPEAA